MGMPTITIYLTNELYDKVRDAPSKTVRAALECYLRSQEQKQATGAPLNSAGVAEGA